MAKKKNYVELPAIELTGFGAVPEIQAENVERAQACEGYPSMCMMLVDVILRRADVVVFDYSSQMAAIKYQIDGLWHPMTAMDRESADAMLEAIKALGGGRPEERRVRQDMSFQVLYSAKKYKFRALSQGMKTGERVALYVDFKRPALESLADLGMREGMIKDLVTLMNTNKSLIVSSALKGEGTTSLWRAMLLASDLFTRDAYIIEDKSSNEPEVINVTRVTFDAAAGENAFSPMRGILLKEPHVIAFSDLTSGSLLNQFDDLIEKYSMQIFTRMAAKNVVESLVSIMALKPDLKKLAQNLSVILAMRVVRKLCTNCRQEFPPSEQMLKALGIPPGRVKKLYRSYLFRPGQMDEKGKEIPPCPVCYGTGFFGRTGLFECLKVDSGLRKLIAAGAGAQQIQKALGESQHVSMREEAVLLIAKGVTSTDEIQRIMK